MAAFNDMEPTLTILLTAELSEWLSATAQKRGETVEEFVIYELECVRADMKKHPWMALAGTIEGSPDLSMHEGFGSR